MIISVETEKFGKLSVPFNDFPANTNDLIAKYGEGAVYNAVVSHLATKVRDAIRGRIRIAGMNGDLLIAAAQSVSLATPTNKAVAKVANKLSGVVAESSDEDLTAALASMSPETRAKLLSKLTPAA